jgi:hypothetical protein
MRRVIWFNALDAPAAAWKSQRKYPMTQFELQRSFAQTGLPGGQGRQRLAPSYGPGGIMALEGGSMTMLGLMPSEIRRTRPGSTRAAYAKGYAQRGW